ncbi:restriction endonuclease [Tsukamurella pulmonis]|uniref:restriction endonuclease n=1 Tax=Tsukamurella pulmonis TaxID=47312 RepID=UPI003C757462
MREVLGIADATVTQATGDGGIDVTSSAALAQVKRESKPTGRPALQNLFGARGPGEERLLLFFSAAGYSKQAYDYADQTEMALFTYEADGTLEAENDAAYALLAEAADQDDDVWDAAYAGRGDVDDAPRPPLPPEGRAPGNVQLFFMWILMSFPTVTARIEHGQQWVLPVVVAAYLVVGLWFWSVLGWKTTADKRWKRVSVWVAAGVVLGGAYWLNPMLGLFASAIVAAAVGGAAQSAHKTRMREWERRHRFGE